MPLCSHQETAQDKALREAAPGAAVSKEEPEGSKAKARSKAE